MVTETIEGGCRFVDFLPPVLEKSPYRGPSCEEVCDFRGLKIDKLTLLLCTHFSSSAREPPTDNGRSGIGLHPVRMGIGTVLWL